MLCSSEENKGERGVLVWVSIAQYCNAVSLVGEEQPSTYNTNWGLTECDVLFWREGEYRTKRLGGVGVGG